MPSKAWTANSWLRGRFPKTSKGDIFLWMKRSAKAPNVVLQKILNLNPGRLYSLKMYTADYQELLQGRSVQQKHAVSIQIENADLLAEKSLQSVFPNCYSHTLGFFDAKNRAWFNFYYQVFRAKACEALLRISDWASHATPGGPIGQELIFNFIEVQPYYE